jgi:regulatory protein
MRQTTTITDKQAAIELAVRALSLRSYSQQEISDKLKKRQCPEEIITQVLSYLNERGYLNDAALAEMVFRKMSQTRKYGRSGILLKLRQRGISELVIGQITQDFDPNQELEIALNLVKNKFKRPIDCDRARICRFLANRGFSGSTISRVLNQIN